MPTGFATNKGSRIIATIVLKARKLLRALTSPVWRSALVRCHVAASIEHERALSAIGDLRTVVDIGANRGQFALAVRHFIRDARIFSFEPLAIPAAVFRRVFERDPHAELHQVAIGPTRGDAEIHLSARDDSSSLLPIGSRQNELFPGTEEVGTARISIARLADCISPSAIDHPALLKLDVQGFELQALAGCDDLLPLFTWVYAECSFVELYAGQALADSVISWLCDRDFALAGIYNTAYDKSGRAVQADLLFRRRAAELDRQ